MAPCSNKENHPPTSSKLLSRRRKLSSKQLEANINAQEAAKAKQIKKQLQATRAKKQASVKKASATVERSEDSKEVRELKARVHQAEIERDTAEHQVKLALAHHSPTPTEIQPDSIPCPSNLSKVTVGLLRQHLGLEGAEHKQDWLRIRNIVRDTLVGVRINWDKNWKSQKNRKLAKLFDAVEEAEPSLQRFQNQWAIEYLAKEVFTGRKTYVSCKVNLTMYRGRQQAKRHEHPSRLPNEQNPPSTRDKSTAEPNDNHSSHSPSGSPFTGSLPALSDIDSEDGGDEKAL